MYSKDGQRLRRKSVAVACVLWLAAQGCRRSASEQPEEDRAKTTAARNARALTAAELDTFAATVLELVEQRRGSVAAGFIHWQRLYERSTEGLVLMDEAQRGFLANVPQRTLFEQLIGDAQEGGALAYLRHRAKAGAFYVLFRQIHADGGFNYVEFVVERGPRETPVIVDFYVLGVGQFVGETLRAEFLPLALEGSVLTTTDRVRANSADAIRHLKELANTHQAEAALAAYEALPVPAKALKDVQLLRLQAARLHGTDARAAALEDFTVRFPDDPDGHVQVMATSLEAGNFAGALAAIDAVDRTLGGDPYLDLQRSNVHAAAGDLLKANAYAKKAAPALSTVHGYLTVVATSLRAELFDDTLDSLVALLKKHRFDFGDLESEPEFHNFLKSKQYVTWQRTRAGNSHNDAP